MGAFSAPLGTPVDVESAQDQPEVGYRGRLCCCGPAPSVLRWFETREGGMRAWYICFVRTEEVQ